MIRWLLLLYPWLELWTLIALGSRWGAGAAMLWVILTAALGVVLIRWVGRSSIEHLWRAQQSGALSRQRLLDDFSVALAGLLFIVPGVISDALALAVLLGPLRHGLLTLIGYGLPSDPAREDASSTVLEGEYETLTTEAECLPAAAKVPEPDDSVPKTSE